MLLSIPMVLLLVLLLFFRPKIFLICFIISGTTLAVFYIYTEYIFVPHHERFIESNNLTIVREDKGFPVFATNDEKYFILHSVHYGSIDRETAAKCRTFNHFDQFSWCDVSVSFLRCYPTDPDCAKRSVVTF